MTRKCNLIVDSCCELPFAELQREGVFLLNYVYTLEGETYVDDLYQSMSAHDFFERMRQGAQPQTAQLPISVLTEVFSQAMQSDLPAVFFSFSSALTSTLDTAQIVYENLRAEHPDWQPVHFFDTKLASGAEALFVREAMVQWQKELTAEQMLEWAEQAIVHVNNIFVVDDLEALKRGGRIPSALAAIGSKLDVKPLLDIVIEDGSLRSCGLARGKKKAIKQMVGVFTKRIPEGDRAGRTICIVDADCPEDAQRLEDMVRKTGAGMQVLRLSMDPVIGSHVGPGMLGMAFWGPDTRK